MIDVGSIQIGNVYGNGKGLYRKVIGFENTFGDVRTNPHGADIKYVKCDEQGNEKGTSRSCWCTTFADWAKAEVTA